MIAVSIGCSGRNRGRVSCGQGENNRRRKNRGIASGVVAHLPRYLRSTRSSQRKRACRKRCRVHRFSKRSRHNRAGTRTRSRIRRRNREYRRRSERRTPGTLVVVAASGSENKQREKSAQYLERIRPTHKLRLFFLNCSCQREEYGCESVKELQESAARKFRGFQSGRNRSCGNRGVEEGVPDLQTIHPKNPRPMM